MRNPDRIKPFLEKIEDLWKNNVPDWRFGQLMFNFLSQVDEDPFFWEEEKFLEKLENFLKGN